jgi:hypothetical protein
MRAKLDMGRIAKGLRAERRGKVSVSGGYFGAMQLAAEVQGRFRVPTGGGRATDPSWTDRRLIPLNRHTLERLERIARRVDAEPMQVAALLLERTLEGIKEEDSER